ncbi:MAG: hypothetical protein ACM30E_01790 [Nitrososphaerales archaeon]
MAYRVSIDELGVANDNTVIEGETPGDVWRGVQKHLKDEHNIKIPDLEDLGDEGIIFPGAARFDNNAVAAGQQAPVAVGVGNFDTDENAESRVIVTRLVEKLHVGQQGSGSSDIVPPGGTQSPMP